MTSTVFEGAFYDLELDLLGQALWLRWKPSSETMSDDDFKEALSNFAGFAIEYRPRHLIVDVRAFRGKISDAVTGGWREANVIPRYNKSDASKMATLASPDSDMPAGAPQRYPGQAFQSARFRSEEELRAWLSQ